MTTGPRTTRPPSCQWSVVSGLAVALLLCASATTAHGQIYWDNISGSGVGGTGFWTVGGSNWNTASTGEDATLTTWANGDSAVFAGTAGVVTLFSSGLSANNVTVSTTGYEFTSSATSRGLIVTNTLTLDSNVSLKLTLNSGTLGTNTTNWSFGAISAGSGASLTLNAGDTVITSSNRLNITSATTVSVPITITAGPNALGPTGIVANGAAVTLNSDITNNSTSPTMLGAPAGSTLTYGGKITGTAGLTFTLQNNGQGAGTVILNSNTSDYTGPTTILNSSAGIVKLGIDNALPSSTALVFGRGTAVDVGALDLNGHNLTVGSLATNTSTNSANGITNTAGSTLSTLTINGNATTTYASIIGVPTLSPVTNASNNIALTLAATNTGTLTLSGANTYFGGTTISGGTLIVSGSGTLGTGNVSLTAAHVTLTLSGTTQIASTATLSYVNMDTINLNYSGTDTIAGLLVDGVPEAPGIYGATAINPDGVFFGSGTVTVVPEPTTVGMMLLGAGLLAGVQRFRRK